MVTVGALLRDESTNAAVGWALVVGAIATAGRSVVAGAYVGALLATLFALVAALPALARRDVRTMAPWPLLAVGIGAVAGHAFGWYPDGTSAVAVVALAMVGVAELDAFTPVEMSDRFAVGFVVLVTLAVQAVWTVVQFYADHWLGTNYLTTQVELQWDILAVTVLAVVSWPLFQGYVRWLEPPGTPRGQEGAGGQ